MRWIVGAIVLHVLLAGCGRSELSERHARSTAEALIAVEDSVPRDLHHMEWQSFKPVTATEAHGTAVLIYRYELPGGGTGEERVPGRFIYRKRPGQGWVLDTIDFPNPKNLHHHFSREVSAKVTDARVGSAAIPSGDHGDRRPDGGEGAAAREPADMDTATEEASSAGAVADGLTFDAARGAAERYLDSARLVTGPVTEGADSTQGRWRARDFRPLVAIENGAVDLPATLIAEGTQGARSYRGVFRFARRTAAGAWALTGVYFQAPGHTAIDREIMPPLVVQ